MRYEIVGDEQELVLVFQTVENKKGIGLGGLIDVLKEANRIQGNAVTFHGLHLHGSARYLFGSAGPGCDDNWYNLEHDAAKDLKSAKDREFAGDIEAEEGQCLEVVTLRGEWQGEGRVLRDADGLSSEVVEVLNIKTAQAGSQYVSLKRLHQA